MLDILIGLGKGLFQGFFGLRGFFYFGGKLLDVAEKEIVEARGRLAIIETSSTPMYEMTRRFHFRHGYEIVACIPDFYAPGDDKLILQKRLK